MTKTHKSDTELMQSVKAAIRICQNQRLQPPSLTSVLIANMTASDTLFELADVMHLGRTRTRALLVKVLADLNSAIDKASSKEVK